MSDDAGKTRNQKLDLLSAIVLSAAALLTTYASYQCELWGGEQAANYSRANAIRVEASRASLTANQEEAVDLMLFGSWLEAHAQDQVALEYFYRTRFRAEFSPAFQAWLASNPETNPHAAATPFAMP